MYNYLRLQGMKEKNIAGLLALFLGGFGIHRFYLGQTGLGIFYLVFFWLPFMWIIGLIDAIAFFAMDRQVFDAKYNNAAYAEGQRSDTDFDRHRRYDRQLERRQRHENRQTRRQQPSSKATTQEALEKYKNSGKRKFQDFDYDGAISDFEKVVAANPRDVAAHFNLACAYSLNEDANKAFYHLDKAISLGFNDVKRIREHDALAFLRIQPQFEEFEKNGFQLVQKLEAPPKDLLSTEPNLLEQLKKLGDLREKGLLTEEEFAMQKKKLLG